MPCSGTLFIQHIYGSQTNTSIMKEQELTPQQLEQIAAVSVPASFWSQKHVAEYNDYVYSRLMEVVSTPVMDHGVRIETTMQQDCQRLAACRDIRYKPGTILNVNIMGNRLPRGVKFIDLYHHKPRTVTKGDVNPNQATIDGF